MALKEQIVEQIKKPVALVHCKSYEPAIVRSALCAALDLLEPMSHFVKRGDRVLLKPNMLSAKEPSKAVTTHPEILVAVGELVLDCGGAIIIGDSPAGQPKDLEKYWDKTGFALAAKRLGVELLSFEEYGVRSFTAPEGHVSISEVALDADVIINLPKLKTHLLTRTTGAVKNMFGVVPGYRKSYMHSLAPDPLPFSRYVVAVYSQVIPTLNIMDAVVGMEGNGPSSGQPREIGALLVSEDAFEIDRIAAQIMGENIASLPVFQAAVEAGCWNWDENTSKILGNSLEEFILPDFEPPEVSKIERIPPILKRNLKRLIWIRPRSNPKLCTACELCIDNCPESCMTLIKDVPEIDYKKCIKCGC
ncbi:MAG: DUF362 domain-containing protein, partial [bacterium]